jgi:ribose 5-phosphate isomerase RpiB
MRIAVINETSAADKNGDILRALEGRGHGIVNCGMTRSGVAPELTYIHTGLMAALLLAADRVDFVIGGCGTGQGFLNSVVQYPDVVCGHLLTPLDAWLFSRINGGNCVSLALNQGYGWAGDIQLCLLFDHLFTQDRESGYPEHRKESQARSRASLARISRITHRPMADILASLPDEIALPAVTYPGFAALILESERTGMDLRSALEARIGR